MKKLLLCLVLLIPLLIAPAFADKVKISHMSEVANVDVQAVLKSNGCMDVTETWTVIGNEGLMEFSTSIKWASNRRSSLYENAGLENVSVSIDGQECVRVDQKSDASYEDNQFYLAATRHTKKSLHIIRIRKAELRTAMYSNTQCMIS